jgi:UDP-N-acetyl-D-glucosamine dehydrogenase
MIDKIKNGTAVIGVIGLGYVGLPLLLEFIEKKFRVIGFDVDSKKPEALQDGKTYIKHIPAERIATAVKTGLFESTTDFSRLTEVDAILICVPTPLDQYRQPDLSYVLDSTRVTAKYLQKGQLIVLESTTYPGTSDEEMLPILEESGLKAGEDFHIAYSPEREDPNNPEFTTATIPKVIGGFTPRCTEIATALYDQIIVKTVPVSSTRVAEATKLLENIFRSINIAMVNELKMVFDKMGIDVWEVIEAASTKPFGFKPFYPGPGLGGHCIPIDPFYLTWKAKEYGQNTRFIELAGEINTFMPEYVITNVMHALNERQKSLNGSRVLLLGLAYKKNVDDPRESPSFELIRLLAERGASIDYHDPFIPTMPSMRKYSFKMDSVALTPENIRQYDCVLISTDHDDVDYELVVKNADLVVDTRNATQALQQEYDNIVKT